MNLFFRSIRFIYRKAGLNFQETVRNAQKAKPAILSPTESNEYFKNMIETESAFMLSRLGTPEANCLLNALQVKQYEDVGFFRRIDAALRGNSDYWFDEVKTDLRNLVGFFPTTDESLKKFASIYSEKISDANGIGVWGFVPGENYIINRYCPAAVKFDPVVLDPYFYDSPWTQKLKGKKVLVIHPFTESIEMQYKKRELLFKNLDVLPEFDLKTIKAVQTIAANQTNFNSWFDALDFMKAEIDKKDFDIALIAAGSYGLPLAAYVKSLGRSAVHMGGALQILFGIKGKRWDDHAPTAALYNQHWVRPSENEVVKNAKIVEGGCYW